MASIFRQQYTVKDADGKTIRKQSKFWYIDYKAGRDGQRKRVKGFKDKTATAQLAAKLEREAELADAGIVDRFKEHRLRPLSEHLKDFKASLVNKGTTAKHAELVHNRAKAVIEGSTFVYISDVSASRVQGYLAERRRDGLGIRSSNFYLQAIKQFCRWLAADKRAAESPLAYLRGQNPNTDIRHARRALTADELDRLIKSTATGEKHSGMTAKERTMLYSLAVCSGFRAGELASLTRSSFNVSDSEPSVTVLAAYSKHRRDDVQLLPLDVAKRLADWQAEMKAKPDEKVFGSFDKSKAAKMLQRDLKRAEIEYRDDSGKVVDFHSLRHTYITNIVKGGASPKVAQNLARHSSIALTMDTYTHLSLYDGRAALASLPELPDVDAPDAQGNKAAALRTGTDDLPLADGAYKPAYKKLTKNAYPDNNWTSSFGKIDALAKDTRYEPGGSDKSLSVVELDTQTNHLSPSDTTEQEGFEPPLPERVKRFSRPSP